jgi:hypothetical protein
LYLSTSYRFTFHPSLTNLQVVGGHKATKCGRKGQKNYGYLNLAITIQNIKHRLSLYILMKRTNDYDIYET